MDDKKVTESIDELTREEHELFERESHAPPATPIASVSGTFK